MQRLTKWQRNDKTRKGKTMKYEPKTKTYKGYTLRYCWCGYPTMMWMVYLHDGWLTTKKTLAESKAFVNELEEVLNAPLLDRL